MGDTITTREYNDLKANIALRDTLRQIAAAVMADQMDEVVARLVECEILPRGTRAQKPSVLHPE